MGHLEFEGFNKETTKALETKVAEACGSAVKGNASAGERLIAATVDLLTMALEDHPDDATNMDIVEFVLDMLEQEESVTERAWIYSGTEAYKATTLGLLQALQALEPV